MIPEKIQELAKRVRNEVYGRDVREAIAQAIEESGKTSEEARMITEQLIDGSYDQSLLNTEIERRLEQLYDDKVRMLDNLHNNKKAELESLEQDFANRAENLETTYAPRLTTAEQKIEQNHQEVTSQLAQSLEEVETIKNNKADRDEVLLKQNGVNINDFDEPTRQTFLEAQGIDVNYVLGEDNVKPFNVSFLKVGKNLFDKTKVTTGKYIDGSGSGALIDSSNQNTSDYIRVKPNTYYTFTEVEQQSVINVAFYDSNRNKIGGANGVSNPILTPENTTYLRFSYRASVTDIMQLEEGEQQTEYESFGYYIDERQVKRFPFNPNEIPNGSIPKEKMAFLRPSRNLFNKSTVLNGYLSLTNGQFYEHSSYVSSDFIPVKENTYYSFITAPNTRVLFYDSNQNYISGLAEPDTPVITPLGTRYVRVQLSKKDIPINDFQFQEGQELKEYEEYGKYFLDDSIVTDSSGSVTFKSHLSGKTIVCFGDSITGAYSYPNDYPTFIAKRLGATVHNVGFSGAKMSTDNTQTSYDAFSMAQIVDAIVSGDFSIQEAEQDTSHHYPAKLETLKGLDFNNVDIITILYGTNDFNSTVPELDNELDEFDKTTVLGAARYAIRELLQAFPHLKIVLLSTLWRTVGDGYADDTQNSKGYYMIDLVNGLKSVSEYHHIPFIDMYNGLGINRYNYTTYLFDGLHPNPTGRKLIADRISSQLLANL